MKKIGLRLSELLNYPKPHSHGDTGVAVAFVLAASPKTVMSTAIVFHRKQSKDQKCRLPKLSVGNFQEIPL